MNKRKLISGLYGLAVAVVGILLETHGRRLESQLFVMTAIAPVGVIGIAATKKAFRTLWFTVAMVASAVLHIAFLWAMRRSLPFSGLGVAIILGTIECFALLFASAKALDIYGQLS